MSNPGLTPLLHITLPEDDGEDRHFAPIILALEAMCAVNEWHIRRSLKRAALGQGNPIAPLYTTGVRYAEDPPGREDWRDCLAVLKRGVGDCVPLSTLVLAESGSMKRLDQLMVGDRIFGREGWTDVTQVVSTGVKAIRKFELSNGATLRCSPDHRVFLDDDGRIREVKADDVHVSDRLLTARRGGHPQIYGQVPWLARISTSAGSPKAGAGYVGVAVQVVAIRDGGIEHCGDITTKEGAFWLPESDVVVHNCDQLVAWRVGELRAAGVRAQPVIKWQHIPRTVALKLGYPDRMIPDGGLTMVHCCVRWPNGKIEDPSKILGMGGGYSNRM